MRRCGHGSLRRRTWLAACSVVTVVALGACASSTTAGPPATVRANTGAQSAQAAAIAAIVQKQLIANHLKAVIYRVTVDGKPLVTNAIGESMTGVPATTAMHFRNGAVVFSYLSTLLMQYVDRHVVSLNDKISKWWPSLPDSKLVSLKMLSNMTAGYPDYETDPAWLAAFNANPFHDFTVQERLNYAFNRKRIFAPGANWSYSHTDQMILGVVLSKIGKAPLDQLISKNILKPLGLTNTVANSTADVPSPVLHSFSSERREALGIPAKNLFYEEATFWNTNWGTPPGASQTTTIVDMAKTAQGIGSGVLLSKASYQAQTGPNLLGFGKSLPGCGLACFKQTPIYNFGLGIVRNGDWLVQNPLLSGQGALEAYLPSKKIAIAIVVTFQPAAFDSQGNYSNASNPIYQQIGALLAPKDAPPTKP